MLHVGLQVVVHVEGVVEVDSRELGAQNVVYLLREKLGEVLHFVHAAHGALVCTCHVESVLDAHLDSAEDVVLGLGLATHYLNRR